MTCRGRCRIAWHLLDGKNLSLGLVIPGEGSRDASTMPDLDSNTSSSTDVEPPLDPRQTAGSIPLQRSANQQRYQRRKTTEREDLEPGSEYRLVHSRTPKRDPNYHDPAHWDDDLVDWDSPTDPANPRNWMMRTKMRVTLQLGLTTMGASFASSSFSPAFAAIEARFNISRTVATLSLSLFVLGL